MIRDLIINAGMLVAFTSVIFQVFRNTELNPKMSIKHRIFSGIIFGMLGIILMTFSIRLPNHIIIDFRNLAILLSSFCGGWVSALISALIIPAYRILFFGLNKPTIVFIVVIIVLAIIFSIIESLNIKKSLKWILAVGISEIVSFIGFASTINDIIFLKKIAFDYCSSLAILSFLLYYFVKYLESFTESYRYYKRESNKDFLTGLNNVRQFDKVYNYIIKDAKINNQIVSLLYIDIDFFKNINDTYGHREGDIVLKKISEILKMSCRSTDLVSRNGGEEFSVILIDCPPGKAIEIAENIRKNVENTSIELSNHIKVNTTLSIGVSSYPDPVNDFEKLREKADEALYEAKHKGRNKVIFYH